LLLLRATAITGIDNKTEAQSRLLLARISLFIFHLTTVGCANSASIFKLGTESKVAVNRRNYTIYINSLSAGLLLHRPAGGNQASNWQVSPINGAENMGYFKAQGLSNEPRPQSL
jgi:hypothetical protein